MQASDHYGVDGVSMVADAASQSVTVFWHGLAPNETAPANATSVTWLYQVMHVLFDSMVKLNAFLVGSKHGLRIEL
jgi:hypothetical protein